MRMGVLDIGSNTGHLAVFDAEPGGRPVQVGKLKEMLRLADHVDAAGALTPHGLDLLLMYVRQARAEADRMDCDVVAVATATVRDAPNRDAVVVAVREASDFDLTVLGEDEEARLTFLAARRWLDGRSPGRVAVIDIGGGSLEIAVGDGETPQGWKSWPLGARRLTRSWLAAGRTPDELRAHVRAEIEPHVERLRGDGLDLSLGTSWTMRLLGKVCGSPLKKADLAALVDQVAGQSDVRIKELLGVSRKRAGQVPAGAIVADVAMELFELDRLEICPWALREGVFLDQLDDL